MSRSISKILLAYFSTAVIYYSITAFIFFQNKKTGNNVLQKILLALGDMFYWISIHSYFALAVAISSIIGMIIAKYHQKDDIFKTFKYILIACVSICSIIVLLANLQ